jgi:hypothetical protein
MHFHKNKYRKARKLAKEAKNLIDDKEKRQ